MDYRDRLAAFQRAHRELVNDRRAFDARRAADPAFTAEIETLYGHFVGTFRKYCGNCWHDAFIQLILFNMDKKNRIFRVLAGTLLYDPVNQDVRFMLTPRRLETQGDDLALRHLAHNPHAIEYFEKPLPDNLDELIADYLRREKGEAAAPAAAPADESETAQADQPEEEPQADGLPAEEQTKQDAGPADESEAGPNREPADDDADGQAQFVDIPSKHKRRRAKG